MILTAITKPLCVAAFSNISSPLCRVVQGFPCSHSMKPLYPRLSGACCVPVWYAAYSFVCPWRCITPIQSGLQRGNQWKPEYAPTPQMWAREKKKSPQKQKCNLEAALRGMTQLSNRLPPGKCASASGSLHLKYVRMHSSVGTLMLTWTRERELWDMMGWWDTSTCKSCKGLAIICQHQRLCKERVCKEKFTQRSARQTQTFTRFIVSKPHPSGCLINRLKPAVRKSLGVRNQMKQPQQHEKQRWNMTWFSF